MNTSGLSVALAFHSHMFRGASASGWVLPSPRVLVLAFFRNFIDLFDRYLLVDELWRQGRGLGLVGLVFCWEDRLLSAPTTDLSTSLGGSGGHSVAV